MLIRMAITEIAVISSARVTPACNFKDFITIPLFDAGTPFELISCRSINPVWLVPFSCNLPWLQSAELSLKAKSALTPVNVRLRSLACHCKNCQRRMEKLRVFGRHEKTGPVSCYPRTFRAEWRRKWRRNINAGIVLPLVDSSGRVAYADCI